MSQPTSTSYKALVYNLIAANEHEKLYQIDYLMEKYSGREEELIRKLDLRYKRRRINTFSFDQGTNINTTPQFPEHLIETDTRVALIGTKRGPPDQSNDHKQKTKKPSVSSSLSGLEMIQKIREEKFNVEVEDRLQHHPYTQAAKDGSLTLSQRQCFARDQYSTLLSLSISFASLAGHQGFTPTSLTNISVPKREKEETTDLFQFLLEGIEVQARNLLAHVKTLGVDEATLLSWYPLMAKAQAYQAYWTNLALSNKRAAGAAACAVNFPAWGNTCKSLHEALASEKYNYDGLDDEGLTFFKFAATPIEELDQMAAALIEEEGATYDELVEHVRLLQEYEVMWWDAMFEKAK